MKAEFSGATSKNNQQQPVRWTRRTLPSAFLLSTFVLLLGGALGGSIASSNRHGTATEVAARLPATNDKYTQTADSANRINVSIQGKSIPIRPGVTHTVMRDGQTTTTIDTRQSQTADNNNSSVSVDMHEIMQQKGGDE